MPPDLNALAEWRRLRREANPPKPRVRYTPKAKPDRDELTPAAAAIHAADAATCNLWWQSLNRYEWPEALPGKPHAWDWLPNSVGPKRRHGADRYSLVVGLMERIEGLHGLLGEAAR